MKDKDIKQMLKPLSKVASSMTFTSCSNPRAASAKGLYEQYGIPDSYYDHDWKKVINSVKQKMGADDVLMITGSLYFISEVRPYVTEDASF